LVISREKKGSRRCWPARGYLRGRDRQAIQIDRLWGLVFGNGASLGRANYLYFTAGPNGEADGLFGSLNFVN